jgi:hypothetical protein
MEEPIKRGHVVLAGLTPLTGRASAGLPAVDLFAYESYRMVKAKEISEDVLSDS